MYLKGQTCLKLSQWWVFQRFSRAAGMSLFRQIAVQVHQWNVDSAGNGPGNKRPTAVIKRNCQWRQGRTQGMIVTSRNLMMKLRKMCEHCQSEVVAEKAVDSYRCQRHVFCFASFSYSKFSPLFVFISIDIYLGKFWRESQGLRHKNTSEWPDYDMQLILKFFSCWY